MDLQTLKLALVTGLPLVYLRTDDILHVKEILTFLAEEEVSSINVPEVIAKVSNLKVPAGRIFYCTTECKSLPKLYAFCKANEKTIIFVNTEKSVLQFDAGSLVPPKELVLAKLETVSETPEMLLPCFGGMTLKDVEEVSMLTMTRDDSLTPRGVNTTRRSYRNLKGISPINTGMDYYVCPSYLDEWLGKNSKFFLNPVHQALVPRGLLFDGNPGTGKTAAAKHIAGAFQVPLYHIDVGAMKGKYVGESEGNLLNALSQVDQVEPCVVLFDEVEKIFQSQSDSGVTSSLLSQLLWWLQEHETRVFAVMTTNKVTSIPAELYREGRIDATMNFAGIESAADAYTFAKGAFDSMCDDIDTGPKIKTPKSYKALKKQVDVLYIDGDAIPQAKLTQLTYSLIRELLPQGG